MLFHPKILPKYSINDSYDNFFVSNIRSKNERNERIFEFSLSALTAEAETLWKRCGRIEKPGRGKGGEEEEEEKKDGVYERRRRREEVGME